VDPFTHAVVGAVAARGALGTRRGRAAPGVGACLLAGAWGALLPDADRLIQSAADPLLHIEFHRHFTHALAFIPVGGLLALAPLLLVARLRAAWGPVWLAATLGYATHGLLDACTSYGTLLLWPFSDRRVAWHLISIVDPLFTALALAGLLVLWRRSDRRRVALATVAICLAYLALGAWQRTRAFDVQRLIATSRGHTPVRADVFPGFATHLLWRSLYEADGGYHMDRVRVPWIGTATWSPGTSATPVAPADLPSDDPRILRDVERLRWFTSGWVARSATDASVLGDARYSLVSDRFDPVWGLRVRPGGEPPVEWVDHARGRRVDLDVWRREVLGRHPAFRALP